MLLRDFVCENMKIIGITGGIGSGKSVVSRILRCNGYPVYDCDMEAGLLMTGNSRLKGELTDILGDEAYDFQGNLNRKYVAEKIFNNIQIRREVNRVVHQAVKEDFLKKCRNIVEDKVFVESAILWSSGLEELCDSIWMVVAPVEVREQRVMKRNGLGKEEIRKRIESQTKEFEELDKGKVKIVNNYDNSPLLEEILQLLNLTQNKEILCLEKF